ncbi:MAG: serine/threonine protein kinase [Candidatus Zixiibacteriota bacterium]
MRANKRIKQGKKDNRLLIGVHQSNMQLECVVIMKRRMENLTGKTISHYLILDRLGADKMGMTYKAEDTELKRIVTLKFIIPQGLESEEEKARFFHEAQVVSGLDHPNIAKIYEIGEAEGEFFISTAYLEGKSLKEIIKDKKISIRAALEMAIKIGEGLTAAHSKEIVHGNLKSQNIMLTREGGIKITDFYLPASRVDLGLTETGMTLGPVQYMSPEQARGNQLDRQADIFSFGVVLYEMIAGQLPFKGEDEAAIIHSIINEEPEPLTKYKREVPAQLQKVVSKLLQKDAKLRYQNMDEVLTDLKRLKLKLISTRPLTFRKVRPRYKTILIPALIICFIIALILLMILNKYLLTPIFEKNGSVPSARPIGVMCYEKGKINSFSESPSQKLIIDSGSLRKFKPIFNRERVMFGTSPLSPPLYRIVQTGERGRGGLELRRQPFIHPERLTPLRVGEVFVSEQRMVRGKGPLTNTCKGGTKVGCCFGVPSPRNIKG